MRKTTLAVVGLFLTLSFLSSQSLVDLSKKEKERRAKLKQKTVKVITKADAIQKPVSRLNSNPAGDIPEQTAQEKTDTEEGEDTLIYATKALDTSRLVKYPEFACLEHDGNFAEIALQGVLDLEIDVKNEPGDDIAIYARLAGTGAGHTTATVDKGMIPEALAYDYREGFWYGVLVLNDKGEWISIGRGTGSGMPETFDMGEVQATTRIRIMFRPHMNADLPTKPLGVQAEEISFGIDAVESLH